MFGSVGLAGVEPSSSSPLSLATARSDRLIDTNMPSVMRLAKRISRTRGPRREFALEARGGASRLDTGSRLSRASRGGHGFRPEQTVHLFLRQQLLLQHDVGDAALLRQRLFSDP